MGSTISNGFLCASSSFCFYFETVVEESGNSYSFSISKIAEVFLFTSEIIFEDFFITNY
jgi:hypothetical protein